MSQEKIVYSYFVPSELNFKNFFTKFIKNKSVSICVFTLANSFYPRENLRSSYAESIIYGSERILFLNKSISIQNHKVVLVK
ncbi:hypothetical protein B0A80_19035 [Flavobacterium tructae]|nr:hypothetical protein B0A80_19035 [Flavobacterium tructae]